MIVSQSNRVPEIMGLILLDCWESPVHKLYTDRFYLDLIEHVQTLDVRYIVNAPSNNRIDLDDKSFQNTLERYSLPTRRDNVCLSDTQQDFARYKIASHVMASLTGDNCTSHLIKRYLLSQIDCVFLAHVPDLLHHANLLPSDGVQDGVQNWLVAGQSWQMCTHDHSLGLTRLRHIDSACNMKFYATDQSFLKQHGGTAQYDDFAADALEWEHITNFGYRLIATQ